MPKPNNYNTSNCESTSSDCVIYDGQNIPCIELCRGDSVSTVTYAIAKELCIIMNQLNISSYELTCLGTSTTPPDFKSFINLLIAKVCALDNGLGGSPIPNPTNTVSSLGCPDCPVNLAPYFQYNDPSTGDLVNKDQVQNYVQKIGITVGDLVGQARESQEATAAISTRVSNLESSPAPKFTLPNLLPTGIANPNVPLPLDEFTQLLEQEFVELRASVGDSETIYSTITTPPSDFNTAKALGTSGGVMSSITGWIEDPQNLSESVTNVWLSLIDLRSGLRNIQLNTNTACEGISINLTGTLENKQLKLFFTGKIPSNLLSCQTQGSLFTVADTSGNYFNTTLDIKNNINNASGLAVDLTGTSLNFADNLKVSSTFCFTDSNTATTCQNYLETMVNNNFNCPTVNVIPSGSKVDFNFVHTLGTLTYSVQLFDSSDTMIQSQNYSESAPTSISGTFSSLSANTLYRIRLQLITINNTKNCPFVPFNTLLDFCPKPNTITAIITY